MSECGKIDNANDEEDGYTSWSMAPLKFLFRHPLDYGARSCCNDPEAEYTTAEMVELVSAQEQAGGASGMMPPNGLGQIISGSVQRSRRG